MMEIKRKAIYSCFYCGHLVGRIPNKPFVRKLHVDHFIPVALGGSEHETNYRIACEDCNLSKSDKMPEDYARESYDLFLDALDNLRWKFGTKGVKNIISMASDLDPELTPF